MAIPIDIHNNRSVYQDIDDLAIVLKLSRGGVLKLAREIACDGRLRSIRHMHRWDLQELKEFLGRAKMTTARELVLNK